MFKGLDSGEDGGDIVGFGESGFGDGAGRGP